MRNCLSFLILTTVCLALCIRHPACSQKNSFSAVSLAWAGGLDACQFCEIDINLDGQTDLLVFDRQGNRLLPMIFTGIMDSPPYRLDTSYISHFPDLHDWVIAADYNGDGKTDLFTYGLGGIRVFRNTSDTSLQFQLVTNMLTSWYYSGYIGILVTPVDYPAVSDIDNDGDLDVLTFFGLGSFVEYHQNLSMEKYGNPDSLDFRLADNCWGKFKESEGSNKITLYADCPVAGSQSHYVTEPSDHRATNFTKATAVKSGISYPVSSSFSPFRNKHTGSTLLATDINGDGLKDLVLGDVDFPSLAALYNGGTPDTALMTFCDTLFPSSGYPVWLYDFPVSSLVDYDHDGLKDLIVSPFDPALFLAENMHSVWYYQNTGSAWNPVFEYRSDRLLQEQMIEKGSVSYPVWYDINRDGLTDLLVGCWGAYDSSWYQEGVLKSAYTASISYFRNTGIPGDPSFTLVTDDLGGLSGLHLTGLFPAFGDLNSDGFPDLITGADDGTLICFINDGSSVEIPSYLSPQWKYQGIDVGLNSAPQLVDFNHDGLPDLIIGEAAGNLNYFQNTGTPYLPVFTWVTDSLGKINVTNYALSYTGYSTPCFFTGPDGKDHLLVGSEEGKIWYYPLIDADPEARYRCSDSLFTLITSHSFLLRCGWRTTPAIACLTSTSFLDLTVGNLSGGLNYFSEKGNPEVLLNLPDSENYKPGIFTIYPNPVRNSLSIEFPETDPAVPLLYRISNLYGQLVCSGRLSHSGTIVLPSFPQGLYFISLVDLSGRIFFASQKIIISY